MNKARRNEDGMRPDWDNKMNCGLKNPERMNQNYFTNIRFMEFDKKASPRYLSNLMLVRHLFYQIY